MAKYNAIYEGRLPHGMVNKIMEAKNATYYQGFAAICMNFCNKIYKKTTDIFS